MNYNRISAIFMSAALALAFGLVPPSAMADEGHGHGMAIGKPGDPAKASKTVNITIGDNFYEPASVSVKPGETIRFVVHNTGELLHEFNIGTPAMHAEHQKEMAAMVDMGMLTSTGMNHDMMKMDHSKMPGMDHSKMAMPMKHDDPNSKLIEPGKTAEITWTFTRAMELQFACNIPGHYESGMVGEFKFN